MKYKVIDIVKGQTIIDTDSQAEIKSWFSRLRRLEDLNVTGKDIRSPYIGSPYSRFFFYEKSFMQIRRYQVIDDEGCSVDPRNWDVEGADESACNPFGQAISFPKYKRHRAHGKGMAFVRQMKREADADLELDVRPVRSSVRIRTNRYDIPKLYRSEELRCWKNKKASRQWARHEKGYFQPAKLADMFPSAEEDVWNQEFLDSCLYDSPEMIFA